MVAPQKAAFAEESAEVEVLFANMEKLKGLTKKIQGSLNRLETSGKNVQEAIGPIYGNTQKLQTTNTNIDKVIEAIDRIREPLDQRNREERIIRAGPRKVGLVDYISSLDRTTTALSDLKYSNLRSNQQAIAELGALLKAGTKQLEEVFWELLREDSQAVEPLHYITKKLTFPLIPEERTSQLRLINVHVSRSAAQLSKGGPGSTATAKLYTEIRGEYVTTTLRNLATASVSTARKTTADAIYKKGTSGIGMYAQGMEGVYIAEYDNVCNIFAREEWREVFVSTCQSSLNEFSKTLRELDGHIRGNLTTDCYLAYEIIEIVSDLSTKLQRTTGELKQPIADALRPIRDTAKSSLRTLLSDTSSRVQSQVVVPSDGAPVPITAETMTRLQTLSAYLTPLSSVLASLGDGGWRSTPSSTAASSVPSFDVGADGRELFAHYAADMIKELLSSLEQKVKILPKEQKAVQGVFLSNNVAIVERMIRSSELQPLLMSVQPQIEVWRKKGISLYLDSWKDASALLFDVQYTNRGARPHSGGGSIDSTAVIKGLGSKEKDNLKEKFKKFNTLFDEAIVRHRSFKMEKEVRSSLAREVQVMLEPLYGRFWDRYHELDKGRGKYIKYDKSQLSAALAGLA